jgi:hypothetical protein
MNEPLHTCDGEVVASSLESQTGATIGVSTRTGLAAASRVALASKAHAMPTLVHSWTSAGDVTPGGLTDALRSGGVLGDTMSVTSLTHESIGVGVGILALLWRLDVRYEPDGAGPRTMILKLPQASAEVRDLAHALRFYEREVGFYDNVAATTPLGTPRCYWSSFDPTTKDFVLLLEDIGALECHDQLVGIPLADVRVVTRGIAAHHAHCWERDDIIHASWTGPIDEPPLPQAMEEMLAGRIPILDDRLGSTLPPGTIDLATRILAGLHPLVAAFVDRGPITLLHGDLRADNLFFTSALDRALVALDWQICVTGRAAYDVGYLMAQSVTSEVRKANERDVLREYHDTLVAHGATGYSLDDAWDDYRRAILWSLVYPVGAMTEDLVDPRALELISGMAARSMQAIADLDATEMCVT